MTALDSGPDPQLIVPSRHPTRLHWPKNDGQIDLRQEMVSTCSRRVVGLLVSFGWGDVGAVDVRHAELSAGRHSPSSEAALKKLLVLGGDEVLPFQIRPCRVQLPSRHFASEEKPRPQKAQAPSTKHRACNHRRSTEGCWCCERMWPWVVRTHLAVRSV